MEKEYKPLIIPQLAWDVKTLTDKYGELIAQPLEPGFGITLGNALRRAVLGSVEGSAVTSVIIKGINNEFSVVPGVVEDAMHLILNIKQIVVRNKEGRSGTMRLSLKGGRKALVSDIVADDHLELVNTDHVLGTIASDGELDITFFVETGRGYEAAKWSADKPYQEDGRIYLDAMFSPITKVMFDVEKTRVGSDIDFDKLIMRIHTNGSESPQDVLNYAVSALRTQLETFLLAKEIPFNEMSSAQEAEQESPPAQLNKFGLDDDIPIDLLLKPIDELELSVRAHNCLVHAGIKRVIDLVRISEDDMLKIKNFGRKSLNEVKDSVRSFGLSFGMDISEQDVKRLLSASHSKSD